MLFSFADRAVSYETLINDIAARVARYLRQDAADPETVSQNEAFRMFGRGNVERWRNGGLVKAYKRPGKVEYRTADLRFLQRIQQDYFKQENTKGK